MFAPSSQFLINTLFSAGCFQPTIAFKSMRAKLSLSWFYMKGSIGTETVAAMTTQWSNEGRRGTMKRIRNSDQQMHNGSEVNGSSNWSKIPGLRRTANFFSSDAHFSDRTTLIFSPYSQTSFVQTDRIWQAAILFSNLHKRQMVLVSCRSPLIPLTKDVNLSPSEIHYVWLFALLLL